MADPNPLADQFRLAPAEELALRNAEATVKTLRDVLRRLDLAGVDVTNETGELDRAEAIRKGFLSQFGAPGVRRGR